MFWCSSLILSLSFCSCIEKAQKEEYITIKLKADKVYPQSGLNSEQLIGFVTIYLALFQSVLIFLLRHL